MESEPRLRRRPSRLVSRAPEPAVDPLPGCRVLEAERSGRSGRDEVRARELRPPEGDGRDGAEDLDRRGLHEPLTDGVLAVGALALHELAGREPPEGAGPREIDPGGLAVPEAVPELEEPLRAQTLEPARVGVGV